MTLKETDEPEEDGDKNEDEDGDDTSICSDTTSWSSGHDTDRTRRYQYGDNHNQRCNQRKCKESRGRHPMNARKEENKRTGKVVLSLFRDSLKEGALTSTDWRREVEEYLRKGYDNNLNERMPCCHQ